MQIKLGDSPITTIPPGIGICVWNIFLFTYDTVCRWIRRFQSGKKDLTDETRSGAPKAATNENAVELVRHAIADDPHTIISIQEITEMLPFTIMVQFTKLSMKNSV